MTTARLFKLETTPDLVDQVYRSLLDAISDGSLAPGLRMGQEEIAARLAVSRQPVLQALRLLKKDGFVLDAPGRGVLVAPLNVQLLVQIYQVRGALDALAARLAAGRRSMLDPRLISQGRSAAKAGKVKPMMAADAAFHNAIYAASGNPMITQSAELHWQHIRRAMGAVLQVSTMHDTIWGEHEAIASAIAAGDANLAEALILAHTLNASHNLARLLGQTLSSPEVPAGAAKRPAG